MKVRTIVLFYLIALSLNANAQAREPSENQQLEKKNCIFSLPPFERAVCCIKYYEGMHRKKDYPYVGYGRRITHTLAMVTSYYLENIIHPICRLQKQTCCCERI